MSKNNRLTVCKPRLAVETPPRRLSVTTTATRRLTGRARQAMRLKLWLERGQCCAMCGRVVEHPGGYHLDHVVPLALGGREDESNLQLLCWWMDGDVAKGCHVDKTAQDGSHG